MTTPIPIYEWRGKPGDIATDRHSHAGRGAGEQRGFGAPRKHGQLWEWRDQGRDL